MHRKQKVGWAAELAHKKAEEEKQPTNSKDQQQTARRATWSLPRQECRHHQARTERTQAAAPNGAWLPCTEESFLRHTHTHNTCTWVQQCSRGGPNRMLMLSWCRGEGRQDPRWIINHWAGPDGGMEGWKACYCRAQPAQGWGGACWKRRLASRARLRLWPGHVHNLRIYLEIWTWTMVRVCLSAPIWTGTAKESL